MRMDQASEDDALLSQRLTLLMSNSHFTFKAVIGDT
jgi:hypothetical protein